MPGDGVLVNLPTEAANANLLTAWEHGDLELSLEFLMPTGSNSGVYLQGRYELQLLDSWGHARPTFSDCGGIYQRWDQAREQGFEDRAPRYNASRAPGLWQELKIVFRALTTPDARRATPVSTGGAKRPCYSRRRGSHGSYEGGGLRRRATRGAVDYTGRSRAHSRAQTQVQALWPGPSHRERGAVGRVPRAVRRPSRPRGADAHARRSFDRPPGPHHPLPGADSGRLRGRNAGPYERRLPI